MLSSVIRYDFNYVIYPPKYKVKLDINDKNPNPVILKHRHGKKKKITLHFWAFAPLNFQFKTFFCFF